MPSISERNGLFVKRRSLSPLYCIILRKLEGRNCQCIPIRKSVFISCCSLYVCLYRKRSPVGHVPALWRLFLFGAVAPFREEENFNCEILPNFLVNKKEMAGFQLVLQLAVVCAVLFWAGQAQGQLPASNAAVEAAIRNPRYMRRQINCLLNESPCDNIGRTMRRKYPTSIHGFMS